MSNFIEIEGVSPLIDGRHELDLTFTNRELHEIKRVSGLRPLELEDALQKADADVVVALAIVALKRAGKYEPYGREVEDALWDAPTGQVRLVAGEDAEPDPTPLAPGENSRTSGTTSSEESVSPENDPSATGSPASGTGSASDLPILAT